MECSRRGCKREVDNPRWKQCAKCRARVRESQAKLRARDPVANQRYQQQWNEARRRRVLAHYGGACVCCGEKRWEFLALDHKDGGGNVHRREIQQRGKSMVGWIIANDFPDLFVVRCHNCNQALGFYGYCPHEQERAAA
jgi:hypothetical protein